MTQKLKTSKITRVAIAAVVGSLLLAFFEAITYAVIIPDLVDANRIAYEGLYREQPGLIPFLLFNLLWATLLTFLFEYWADIRTFTRGAMSGAVIMGAIVTGINLGFIAFFNMLENIYLIVPVKVAFMVVTGAVAGGVIAMILGWENRKSHSIN
jgi:drug/metabolite transporter (DMT)-like permease